MYVHDLSFDSKTYYPLFVIICSLLRMVPLATLIYSITRFWFFPESIQNENGSSAKVIVFSSRQIPRSFGNVVPTCNYFSLFFKLTFLWLDLWPLTGCGSASLAIRDCLGLNGPCGQLSIVMSPDVLCFLRKILFFYTAFFFCICPSANCPYPTVFLGQKHNVSSLLETVCFVNFIVFNFQFCYFPSVFASRTWISFSLV